MLIDYKSCSQAKTFLSCSQFTLTIEGIQSEVKVFTEDEPSLQGITELQIKFIDVSGVSGASFELTVLGCAEGNHIRLPSEELFPSIKFSLTKNFSLNKTQSDQKVSLFGLPVFHDFRSLNTHLLTLGITTDGIN